MTDQHAPLNPTTRDEWLFAFFDGELDNAQLQEFQEMRASDPSIETRLQALQTLDSGIDHISHTDPQPLQLPPKGSNRKWIAYAALLAVCASLYIYMNPSQPQQTFDARPVYQNISADFEAQHICDTPEKFERYTRTAFGITIRADFETATTLVGWRAMGGAVYDPDKPPRTPSTRILMTLAPDGTPTLAFFVPRGVAIPTLAANLDLNVFERSFGKVNVYEVTPLDEPYTLPLLSK